MTGEMHVLVQGLPDRSPSASPEIVPECLVELRKAIDEKNFTYASVVTRRLTTYYNLKGRFSLDDHAKLTNMLLELVKSDGQTLSGQIKTLKSLKTFLQDRRVGLGTKLTELKWQELLAIAEKTHWKPRGPGEREPASIKVLTGHATALADFCRVARYYYSADITDEVCKIAYAYMEDPLSRDLFIGQTILTTFLPSTPCPAYADHIRRWVLEEWSKIEQCADWDAGWLRIVRRALKWGGARACVNDDISFLAELARRVQMSLRLPSPSGFTPPVRTSRPIFLSAFGTKTSGSSYGAGISVALIGQATAADYYSTHVGGENQGESLLTSNSREELMACLDQDQHLSAGLLYMRRLLTAIQTLFHPSNADRNTTNVVSFAANLCENFVRRLGRERAEELPNGDKPFSAEDKRSFVATLLPLVTMGMYSKIRSVVHLSQVSIGQLAYVAPITVADHFIEVIAEALDPNNLNQTHHAPAAIKMLTVLLQPLLQVRPLIAEALPEFLDLALPGIDSNDIFKTVATNMLYQVVLSWVPIIDVEAEGLEYPSHAPELTGDSRKMKEGVSISFGIDDPDKEAQAEDEGPMRDAMWRSNNFLVEWSLACLERLLMFIGNQVKRAKGGVAEQMDNAVFSGIAITGRLLFSQMSPAVRARAGDRINEWALDKIYLDAIRESKSIVRSYVASFVAGKDEKVIKEVVLKGLFEPMLKRATNPDSSERMLQWSLVILGAMARVLGTYLLPYENDIMRAIDLALEHEDASVRKLGGKLLRRSIRGLCERYIASRSSIYLENDQDKKNMLRAAVSWGQPQAWTDTCSSVQWHEPTKDEISMAKRLSEYYRTAAMDGFKKAMSDNSSSLVVRKELELLFQVTRASSSFVTGRSARHEQMRTMSGMLSQLLKERETDTVSHRRIIKSIRTVLTSFGSSSKSAKKLHGRNLWFAYMRETMNSSAYVAEIQAKRDDELLDRRDWIVPRFHQLDDVQTLYYLQQHQRAFENARADKDEGEEDALKDCFGALVDANEHDWTDTRQIAAEAIKDLITRSPWFGKAQIPTFLDALLEKKLHGRILGAGDILSWNKMIRWISSDWYLLDQCLRALILDASVTELPEDKQRPAADGLRGLMVLVLQAWTHIPLDKKTESLRAKLLHDVTCNAGNSLSWRNEIASCVVACVLAQTADEALDESVLSWITSRTTSDVLPLRSASSSVLVQLLQTLPDSERSGMVTKLSLGPDEFSMILETLSQDHSNATVSVDGNAKGIKQKSDWSAGVGELLRLARFPGSRFSPRTCMPSHAKTFSTSHMLIMKSLCESLGAEACVNALLPHLESLLFEGTETAEHQSRICASAEVFAGLVNGGAAGNKSLLDSVLRAFDDASLESAEVWLDSFRLAPADGLHLQIFVEKLMEMLDSTVDGDAIKTTNLLRVVRALVYESEPSKELEKTCAQLAPKLVATASHPYETVRRELGRTLAALIDVSMRRDLEYSSWAEKIFSQLDKAVLGVSREKETSATTRTYETALHLSASIVMCGGPVVEKYLVYCVPVILEAQGHPNVDVGGKAKSAAGCMASVTICESASAVELIRTISENDLPVELWHARVAVVQLLGALFTLNMFSLGYAVGAIHTRKEIEKLLRDPQVEVQTIASAMLMRVLSAYKAESASLEVTRDRYVKLANTKVKRDQYKTDEGKEKLKKRMTGVLGLSAVVNAFPYTVPFPQAVVALARRVNDPAGVGNEAQKAVADFKRTHADTWEKTKRAFTTEELEDLQDSSASTSHS